MCLVYIFSVSTEYIMFLIMHPYVMKGGVWADTYLHSSIRVVETGLCGLL